MRRSDRLFQIAQILRARRLTTARYLADRLEVSERTIYRDIRDLSLSGVPIVGEAGVGYALKKGYELPPLMFDYAEVEALVIGARMVNAWGGTELARHAERAMEKIAAVLPDNRRAAMETTQVYVPDFQVDKLVGARFETLRQAVKTRNLVRMRYQTPDGRESKRDLRPLALAFWGQHWTLAAWCELRQDFRSFRLDRVSDLTVLETTFRDESGKTMADYMRRMEREDS